MLVSMPLANGPRPVVVWAPATAAVTPTTAPSAPTAAMIRVPINRTFIGFLPDLSEGISSSVRSIAAARSGPEAAAREEAAREVVRPVLRGALGGRRRQRRRQVGEHHLLTGCETVLDLGPGVADGADRHCDSSCFATLEHLDRVAVPHRRVGPRRHGGRGGRAFREGRNSAGTGDSWVCLTIGSPAH